MNLFLRNINDKLYYGLDFTHTSSVVRVEWKKQLASPCGAVNIKYNKITSNKLISYNLKNT